MTQAKSLADDVSLAADRLLRTLPVHLQRPGWQSQESGGAAAEVVTPAPCTGKNCQPPPCKGLECINTIIGHGPAFVVLLVLALAIGLIVGYFIGVRRSQSTEQ